MRHPPCLRSAHKAAPVVIRVLVASIVFLSAACAPRDYLREDYMGKRYLQPDRFPQQVRHDANGKAIVETERRWGLLSSLPTLRLPRIPLPRIPLPSFDLPDIKLPDLWPFDDDEEDDKQP